VTDRGGRGAVFHGGGDKAKTKEQNQGSEHSTMCTGILF
jgi:hypothetical protein